MLFYSVKPPRHRRGGSIFGLNTPRQGGGGRGVFKPNTPLPSQGKVVLQLIPLRAGIRVKFHSQFSPNSTGQQCNLEVVRFEPNPPRAV